MNRRQLLRAAATVPLLAACNGGDKKKPIDPGPATLENVGEGAAPGLEIGDAEAELLVGQSRYAFALIGPDGPIEEAKGVTVYSGPDPTKAPTATVGAVEFADEGLRDRGLYVANLPFPTAGPYYVAVVAETSAGKMRGGTRVEVKAKSASPVAGDKAPAVVTPTVAAPAGADPLCSRTKQCGLHTISFDKAIKNGKPTVVVFAAPAFCQTELCGPDVEILLGIATKYAGRANFIHVEAYRDATNPTDGKLAPALKAFKFESEPWLYVVDAKGVVSDRLSGAFASGEVETRLEKVLQ